jgi:hypothetical protein
MTWLDKFKKKKEADKEFEDTMNMYTNLPECCLMCQKDFDKSDKQMVKTWNMTVKKKESKVNLYCPDCWNMAMDAVKEGFNAAIEEKNKPDE